MWRLPAAIMADRGLMMPGGGGRWLLVWLFWIRLPGHCSARPGGQRLALTTGQGCAGSQPRPLMPVERASAQQGYTGDRGAAMRVRQGVQTERSWAK
jgi:hypothetical protein